MSGGDPRGTAGLLEDWVTIWHSELAATLADRELIETQQRLLDAWAAQSVAMARAFGAAVDAARAGAPAGPAPAVAAPDGRRHDDTVIAGLLARVAELERRLAELSPAR